jgi:predicted HTH domain antitoxin
MIICENGRYSTTRPQEESKALLQLEIDKLPPKQRAALSAVLASVGKDKKSNFADLAEQRQWDPKTGPAVPVREWVNDRYLLGETAETLFPILKEKMIELFEGDYYECILCLHPDTEVPLLDGSTSTIAALAERWKVDPTPFWVYSYVNGEKIAAEAIEPRQTGVDDYFKVTLDDDRYFIGNSRHQMIMSDGSKRMIKDMSVGDSIMPFATRLSDTKSGDDLNGYQQLQLASGGWDYTHRLVARKICHKPTTKHSVVHHKNFNKLNNDPANLEWKTRPDHTELHRQFADHERRNDVTIESIREAARSSLRETAEILNCSCSRIRRVLRNHGFTQREFFGDRRGKPDLTLGMIRSAVARGASTADEAARMLNRGCGTIFRFLRERGLTWFSLRKDLGRPTWKTTVDQIKAAVSAGSATRAAVAHRLGCDEGTIYQTLKRAGLKWSDLSLVPTNHFVTRIEHVGRGPVYCMTVPNAGNFAICTATDRKEVLAPGQCSGVMSSNTGSARWG